MYQLSLVTYRTIHNDSNYLRIALTRCNDLDMLRSMCESMKILDTKTCNDLQLNESTLVSMIMRSVLPPSAVNNTTDSNNQSNNTVEEDSSIYPNINDMFNANVVPLKDLGSPSLDTLSPHYLTWDQYVSRSRHIQSLHLKAMVRSQLLHAIDTNGDDLCDIQEVLDLNVRPPAVGTTLPISVSLDIVVNGQGMEALNDMRRGDVLILTTIGRGIGQNNDSSDDSGNDGATFVASATFVGAKDGYEFKSGNDGVGYYLRNTNNNESSNSFSGFSTFAPMEVDDDDNDNNDNVDEEEENQEEVDDLQSIVNANKIGITRLCVVKDLLDDQGTSLFTNRRTEITGNRRTIRVRLPAEQYSSDSKSSAISNYSFRHIILAHRDVKTSYHILHHLKSSLSSSDDITGSKGGKPCVPGWLRETLVQGKVLEGGEDHDEEMVNYGSSPSSCYDLGNTFQSMKHLKNYLIHCGGTENDIQYEDDDDKEDLHSNSSLFRTRLLLPSGTIQVYLGEKKFGIDNQHNHHQKNHMMSNEQLTSIIGTLKSKYQLSLIRGGPGTGKTECIVDIVAALCRGGNERVLLLAPTVSCIDRLLSKLERFKQMEKRHIIRVGGSGHGYGNFGPAGRRQVCQERQRLILNEVSMLSTSLGITKPGTSFTCETAGHFYNVHVKTRVEEFEKQLEMNGGALDPFALHYQQMWGNGIKIDSESVMNRMERLTSMFSELKDYNPFEWMPFAQLQMSYLVNSLSRVVGASIGGFLQEMEKYEDCESGPSFTTIVVDGASHMTDAALAVVLAYNRNRTTRVILAGDDRSSTIVSSSFSRLSSEALYFGAKLSLSTYERLSKNVNSGDEKKKTLNAVHDLSIHHRSRDAITSLYGWRYGSNMQLSLSKKKAIANAGIMYPTQFIDVNDGMELTCPQGGFQNIQEAEYLVSLYQYMRLCGHQSRSIVILTTYDDQVALIKDVMNLRCVDSVHFGKPAEICTMEQFVGREADIVLFSMVRTNSIPESMESMSDIINFLSRAKLGLYIFGKKSLYDDTFSLTPTMSKYSNMTSKLCLIPGESHPTLRDVKEAVSDVCNVENYLHMAAIVRLMVGAPLLPGSTMRNGF
jgi:hypothetical protein